MRTRRRAISLENSGLLPVAIQVQRIGRRIVSETPRIRSSQKGAVRAAARAEESSLPRRLSIKTMAGIWRSFAVIRLRHSSSSRLSVMTRVPVPVRMVEIASTMRVAPVPGDGFSIRCRGVEPLIKARTKPSKSREIAWARSASEVNGKSPNRSSCSRSRASAICSGLGCSGTAGILKPEMAWYSSLASG